MPNPLRLLLCLLAAAAIGQSDPLSCDLSAYRDQAGLKAQVSGDALQLSWTGEQNQELRASFAIERGVPTVRELAARKSGGQWKILGRGLTPEYSFVSGKRRIGTDQLETDGARIEVSFPGLSMDIFSGRLQYTVYKGANLLRQEAIAKTDAPDVAYKYDGGLKGFRIGEAKQVVWRDVARGWQKYAFGGSPNQDPMSLRARNRLGIVETSSGGSVAFFPAPHKFFFAREIELNLGYVYYRKDDEQTFGVGARQAEREEFYRPFGFSDAVWNRRVSQTRSYRFNFALYNAPSGTWQRMAVYFYLSPEPPEAAHQAVMAFTHGDTYKPLPGYGKVYHVGSVQDELEMLKQEGGYAWLAHPRTKSSDGYPEAIKDSVQFKSDRYLGASYQSLPADLSHSRLCEVRCFSTLDDMNNWGGPKFLLSEGDTYAKFPDDETYPYLSVNYVKFDRVPRYNEDWTPILNAIRAGNYFVTSGEVLIKNYALEGSGNHRTIVAELEWTYPLEFLEVVWGDGQKTDRQIISATSYAPFGSHTFRIPVDVAGKKWVRFAAWDSTGDGAFVQPLHLSAR